MAVSVIIAALNEAAHIEAAVHSAFQAGAQEVIVADGGSADATGVLAASGGARVLSGSPPRGRQFNEGARAATGETLIFLHADSILPAGSAQAVDEALARGLIFGGFRVRFAEGLARLRYVAFMINLRTSMTRAPWGDQAQFLRRTTFLDAGGFREIPIMEDYELAARMKRRGPTGIIPLEVTTSGRRFLARGLIRTSAINWSIVALYHLGVDPVRLARIYRTEGRGPRAEG